MSPKPLVIVESPAKAKTIGSFLGSDYDVRASVGHVADLPSKGLAVDVDNHFKPTYELTERGAKVVKELRQLVKQASALYLATDEDREGEAISWHLYENLKSAIKPGVEVHRVVFHEITKSAIEHAFSNPRDLDVGLVDAAETRRILDRLFGYEVSPVLWRKVNRGLSAGRVQSPTVRLIVERERERIAFVSAGYWGVDLVSATSPSFTANLLELDGVRIATGKDFDDSGRPSDKVTVLGESAAVSLVDRLRSAPVTVRSVDDKPYRSSPKAPFMTSTLQQEAGRKLRLSAQQVMRTAQGLYERGFITYMRTDSVVLADEALDAVRAQIGKDYGSDFVSSSVRRYASKVKNAQEAHEAIRPTLPLRSPDSVAKELSGPDLALYRLVWQRTLASQMADAAGVTVSIRLGATAPAVGGEAANDCTFAASGTTITFPGHRKVYEESTDDESDSGDDKEALLPSLTVGDTVAVSDLVPGGHETTPPARYTEASIVKKLEELGIGRPSTWASIIQTVQDRGYVWKKGQALVPTWTAFAVVTLLERHFGDLVDYAFTAGVEEELDEIAGKSLSKDVWLHAFYFGDAERGDLGELGLKRLIEQNIVDIDAASINSFPVGADPTTGEVVNVKPGKYGPYVKRGDDTAGVPDNLAPDELTIDEALRLLSMPKSDEPIGEWEGHPVFAKNGRYGPYVQWGTMEEPPEGLAKPKMVSLFKTMALEHITMRDALDLLSLPRSLGADPTDGVEILANNGRYGPYVQKEKDYRTIDNEERLLTITLDEAVQIFSQPKQFRRGRSVAAKGPLREFGNDPVSERPVVAKDGQYGVYVTDGEVNASLGKGDRIEDMLPERAYELLAIRREVMAEKGITPKKKAGAKKSTAKKAAPKKAATKKTSAKKAAPKKAAAKKTS
ncbi:MAG: type I DNA topoisomerase [Actinomycetota bacterium]|nr:type I DNA topoisomerase [Actinomycetota bacterium]MDA3001592.1 type I DNA topoisomerase [Actinomycetota bacterium]